MRETLNTSSKRMIGLSGLTNIIFNSSTKSWNIISLVEVDGKNNEILGSYDGPDEFPIGSRQWNLNGVCESKTEENKMTLLKLTKVCCAFVY
jgi:hypothetical protein